MIGTLTYQEIENLINSFSESTNIIKSLIEKYDNDTLNSIKDFCGSLESYSRFINSYIELYKYSDDALKTIIDKNK